MKHSLYLIAGMAVANLAVAQDARKVIEPKAPPVCAAVVARASAPAARGDDAARIQRAIDDCPAGKTVRLAPGVEKNAFTSGPLNLKSGVTLQVDGGVTLYASTHPRDYDHGQKTCGTIDQSGKGCRPFISADRIEGSGIMGEGIIDGRGGQLMDGKTETWWQLARRAQKERAKQNVPRLIEVNQSREFTMHGVTLRNSPNFHVVLSQVDGATIWGIKIDTPHDARNTDGIDPISSRNITIAHSFIRTGDDNIAIKAGSKGRTENISVLNNHFYNGHGMSIGSETDGGVRNVLVDNLSMDGATSGLRIKSDVSRGGEVGDVRYRNVCLRNVRAPIELNTRYDPKATGNRIPLYRDIAFEGVRSLMPGRIIISGYDALHPIAARLDNVVIDGNPVLQIAHAKLALGPGPVSPVPTGENVALTGASTAGEGINCELRFAPFPERAASDSNPNPHRPQLTTAQAERYSYNEVLKYTGTIGRETVDSWDPLKDTIATGTDLKPDYIVDASAKTGDRKTFATAQAAINQAITDAAMTGRTARQYIQIKPGTYRELLYVPPSPAPITLYGIEADAAKTRIVADLNAGTSGETYARNFGAQFKDAHPSIVAMFDSLKDKPTVSTPGSTIAWIRNAGFQAKNITFENAWNRGDTVTQTPAAITTQLVQTFNQAVALTVDGADRVQFENVRFLGFQDTLYLTAGTPGKLIRSFFHHSYIEGDTDFIFGDGTAYFLKSEIKSRGALKNYSYIAAPSTHVDAKFGFVFNECKFTHDSTPNALAGKFHLGRQWFRGQRCTPYGAVPSIPGYSCSLGASDVQASVESPAGSISKGVIETVGKVIILNSVIGPHIDRNRPWHDWNFPGARQFRPAQYSSDDFWNNLTKAGIDPVRQLGYAARKMPVEPFLGEFNTRDE
ncbi:MAG: pectin lyase fold-containing protein [Betaproteobacteria bacterium]|nr:pectin lyase fold-containing protein [Betaproteobacteria bacterium]